MLRLASFLFAVLVLGLVSGVAQEGPPPVLMLQGNAEAGSVIASETCAACHGQAGNSTAPTFPRLSGQLQEYLAVQLWILKEGIRPSQIMNPIASTLTDQEIADLAAYYANEEPNGQPWPSADQALAEQGAAVYMQGNVEGGVIACAICHGGDGAGIAATHAPRIAGQAPQYVQSILHEFAMVPDFGVPVANAMHIVASALSEEEMEAVVAFLASQPWGNP